MLSNLPHPKLRSFVIGGNTAIERIFTAEGYPLANGLGDAELIVFQGGEDVSPYLYGEEPHPTTHSNSKRDVFEFACYKATQGKFRVGICRGAQFLNVMNGGWLWQHVDGHCNGPHSMKYLYNRKASSISQFVTVTSTHHQLMQPKGGQIWGQASETRKRESVERKLELASDNHYMDAEIVHYPNTRCLCFQPHPEYNSRETREVFFDCVARMVDYAAI